MASLGNPQDQASQVGIGLSSIGVGFFFGALALALLPVEVPAFLAFATVITVGVVTATFFGTALGAESGNGGGGEAGGLGGGMSRLSGGPSGA